MTSGPQKIPERIASAREAIDAALIANQYDSEETTTLNDALRALAEATSSACGMGMGETTVELVNSCSRMMVGEKSD